MQYLHTYINIKYIINKNKKSLKIIFFQNYSYCFQVYLFIYLGEDPWPFEQNDVFPSCFSSFIATLYAGLFFVLRKVIQIKGSHARIKRQAFLWSCYFQEGCTDIDAILTNKEMVSETLAQLNILIYIETFKGKNK